MCKVPRRFHTDIIFYSLGILNQIQCHNVLFLHKILNNKVHESDCETFALMLHSQNNRSNNQIIIPQINTNCLVLILSNTNVLMHGIIYLIYSHMKIYTDNY